MYSVSLSGVYTLNGLSNNRTKSIIGPTNAHLTPVPGLCVHLLYNMRRQPIRYKTLMSTVIDRIDLVIQ